MNGQGNLAGFVFETVTSAPTTSFDPIPIGVYEVMITKSEIKKNKAGTGSYIQLSLEIISGQYTGRLLWDILNTENPNEMAVKRAHQSLTEIRFATGVQQPTDTADFHDKLIKVKVGFQKQKNPGDEPRNQIKAYMPANAGSQPQAAPVASAPVASAPVAEGPWSGMAADAIEAKAPQTAPQTAPWAKQ